MTTMMTEIKTPIKTLDNYDTLSLAESELPPYSAKASSSLRSREYRFHRGNGITGRARISGPDGTTHSLDADIHRKKPSTIRINASNNSTGGFLAFPSTHNDFQINTPIPYGSSSPPIKLTQARARVGHPHPASYSFTLPSSNRKVVWTRSNKLGASPSYQLREEGSNSLMASLHLVPGLKHQASLRLYEDVSDSWDETVILLSFVGVLTRLHLKGKDPPEASGQRGRWNGMWFMAILGSAAVA
ncbi:uncharacterized protein CLAFUR5_06881 [Fulvia fulva]|uniref:Uncharacterized protein n=1 Tax=Passalora fulva TaxID=5499 RepID=A0A9Q8UQS9_PASFU|nr:uncharacterized protein CLAFUR5_06881 [Fulvia fulva]KAK4622655.1 hypothetical protein CLAFUR0_06747 [Fulvia fulva]UJO19074.1 hypothetical protein CLAFUR5_06881 [Fulvia fulva]